MPQNYFGDDFSRKYYYAILVFLEIFYLVAFRNSAANKRKKLK